ncbi:hypothetical protein Dde_3684 [Oleidesulfovibrio alaskensis G20]|jgi:hypothetical protein|uniref:HTH arsR-type domain-containing protein n=2 Tax=Oleidesulfovibrio alaskensis TaxID=58180 RepID=Q30V19_OLEA2|nr:hypothetical protein Dde_3684 [Oleidesulfovibrio alaskensis G20]
MNMLSSLFTSKTRVKLLIKLFLNPDVSSYLRELASEFELSPNALKEELDGLSQAGYLNKEKKGRYIFYNANRSHPFFPEISSIVRKHMGIDGLVEIIVNHLGTVLEVYILDDYANGVDSGLIDVLIVGDVDPEKVHTLCVNAEKHLKRRVRTLILTETQFEDSRDVIMKRPHWKIF